MKNTLLPLALVAGTSFAGVEIPDQANDPIIISATRIPGNQSILASDITVLKAEDLTAAPGQTLDEVLSAVAGIETVRAGPPGSTSSFFVRGANSNHTLILLDGQRINSAADGTSAIQHIPLGMIDRIEIIRGSASSAFGSDAIGGVIQIFTKRGAGQPHLDAGMEVGSYGHFAQNLGFSGEVNNTAFNIAAGKSHARGYNATTPENTYSYNPDRDGYSNMALNASIDHRFTEEHILGASVYAADSKVDFDNSPYQYSQNRQKLRNTSVYSKNRLQPWWESEIRIGQSRNTLYQTDDDTMSLVGRTTQNQMQWTNHFDLGQQRLLAGVEWRNEKFTSDAYTPDNRRTFALLAGYHGSFGAHNIQVNLRRDDSNQFGNENTGNIGYSFAATRALRLYANVGRAFHAPTFVDLYYPNFSNPDLKPEKAHNYEAGANYRINNNWKVGLAAWQTRITDLIQYNNVKNKPENISRAKLTGATLSTEGKWASFSAEANFNIQNPVNTDTGKVLPRRAKQYGSVTLKQDLGRWSWFSEMRATAYRYDSDSSRLGGYTLFNIGAEYRINKAWGVNARINNLFDKDYTALKGYNTPGINGVLSISYSGL